MYTGVLSALRGPLLQRATLINEHAQLEKNGTMELRMAQILPQATSMDQDLCSLAALPNCTTHSGRALP